MYLAKIQKPSNRIILRLLSQHTEKQFWSILNVLPNIMVFKELRQHLICVCRRIVSVPFFAFQGFT